MEGGRIFFKGPLRGAFIRVGRLLERGGYWKIYGIFSKLKRRTFLSSRSPIAPLSRFQNTDRSVVKCEEQSRRADIAGAMALLEHLSCVKFLPKTDQKAFVAIFKGDGCHSKGVGMIHPIFSTSPTRTHARTHALIPARTRPRTCVRIHAGWSALNRARV